jgi:hypothetical protein
MHAVALKDLFQLVFADRTTGIQAFGCTHDQEQAFKQLFMKALVTSCISFNFVENGYLVKAFKVLGMSGLTRKEVSGPLLDQLAEENAELASASLAEADFIAGSSDGWRKKTCEGGSGLMDFTVMGSQGEVPGALLRLTTHE